MLSWESGFRKRIARPSSLVAYRNLVSDRSAMLVALRFHLSNGKMTVLEVRHGALQSPVQLVFKLRHLFGRSENTGIDAIFAVVSGAVEQLNLLGLRRERRFRLIAQPFARHKK